MKIFNLISVFLFTLLLTLCQLFSGATPSEAPTPVDDSPAAVATSTSPAEVVADTAGDNMTTATGQETELVAGDNDLPASTIFEVAWQDRALFKSGLIAEEAAVLDDLPEASVYHIDFTINNNGALLSGREEVRYTNLTGDPLGIVYFHLYPNLLDGFATISNVTVNGTAVEPLYQLADSAMGVPLPETLLPGQQVVFGMDFTISVPVTQERNYGIFANVDNILALAHFYPLIARYEAETWDIETPSSQGDVVYADTSFYLVRVTAPADQIIVASGVMVEHTEAEGTQTLTFAAGPMRDFYLAASKRYGLVQRTVGQTTINSYFLLDQSNQAAQMAQAELAAQYTVDALTSFNERYGIYPFTELDIVPTANLALGIEYPGIVAINLLLYDPEGRLADQPTPYFFEPTIAHEIAHQWFYSLIGNDQLEEPWVDEALTQYATWRYYLDVKGAAGAQGFEAGLQNRWNRSETSDIPIGKPVSAYDGVEYSAIIYGRGPLFFAALAEAMGQETLDQFLHDYALTYRWRIAKTDDLKHLAEQHCDCDLSALFADWVYD